MSAFKDQDAIRVTQLVEDYHPIIRRRAVTSIRTSYPSFFPQEMASSIISINESQKMIVDQYNKIHNIIDLVDDHIRRRIQCYENEVVSVVQKQIQQMRQQTGKVVQQFNLMIQQKNKQTQIWSLNNELDYFKSQAKKLFQQNRQMKKQNIQFKKRIKQYEYELQNKQIIMQKLLYKYQKQKYYKQKLKQKMVQQIQSIKKQAQIKRKIKPYVQKILQFEVPEIKLNTNSFSWKNPNQQICQQKIVQSQFLDFNDNQKIDISEQIRKSVQSNSVLDMDYEDECSSSSISFNGKSIKSINIRTPKVQMKNQSSQANIYLSEHSYKDLFQKKNKIVKTQTKQNGVQTQNQSSFSQYKNREFEYQTANSSPLKKKQINFTKNGFHVKSISNYQSTHTNFKKQPHKQVKSSFNRYNLLTQPDFNKQRTESVRSNSDMEKSINRNKPLMTKNSFYKKMARKFENNKITQKAYSKQRFKTLHNQQNI